MDRSLAKQYLKEYSLRTNNLFKGYFQNKVKKADFFGKINLKLLNKLMDLTEKGKRIRGSLIVLGYQIAGGKDLDSIYETSLFIELFHTGILIHDDIMDKDDFRRGLMTFHKEFGKINKHYGQSVAICAGDLAMYLSWEKLLSGNFSKQNLVKASRIYADYVIRLAHGQVMDVSNINIKDVTEQDIMKIIKYKTAEYTSVLPLLIGATLGGLSDKKKLQGLKNYGLFLGLAFQIQDDILGIFGDKEKTGKPVGSDIKDGKITLLMFHGIKNGTYKEQLYLKKMLGNEDINHQDILKIRRLLKKTGAYTYVLNKAKEYIKEGKKEIPKITKKKFFQEILESLIILMVKRMR